MRNFFRRVVAAMGCGYIAFFFSERVFWSRWPDENIAGELIATWIAYSILASVFLSLVAVFRSRDFWAVFLCGAVYGWLAEGVLVDTMYWDLSQPVKLVALMSWAGMNPPGWLADLVFPCYISFTGLAWHALITMCVGWYVMGRVLRRGPVGRVALVASIIGLGWGLWAIYWPNEGITITVGEFAVHSFAMTAGLIAAYLMQHRAFPPTPGPSVIELVLLGLMVGAFYILVRVPATPASAYILPPLIALCLLGLWRNALTSPPGSIITDVMRGPIPMKHALALLSMPLTALGVFLIADSLQRWPRTNQILFVTTTPAGYICFLIALFKLVRRRRAPTQEIP